jgi:VCBS repeat-containing protein
VKVGRGGNVQAIKAGTATITVTNKDGSSNDVVITVREPASPSFAGTGAGAGSDAREAAAA